jgi:hypothetical protein
MPALGECRARQGQHQGGGEQERFLGHGSISLSLVFVDHVGSRALVLDSRRAPIWRFGGKSAERGEIFDRNLWQIERNVIRFA